MKYAEIGVYVLGATALAILAAAGITLENETALFCAVVASGAAYLAQMLNELASRYIAGPDQDGMYRSNPPAFVFPVAALSMFIALGSWAVGVFNLI